MMKNNYTICFNDNYLDDELYQFEVKSKGCLFGTIVKINNKSYTISFYDTTRFKQDVDNELQQKSFFHQENTVFINEVTVHNIHKAIEKLHEDGTFDNMTSS